MGYKSDFRDHVLSQPPSFKKKKNYVLRKELGRGGFGRVLQATWNPPGGEKVDVAIKVLIKERQIPGVDVLAEVRALQGLQHPNVVRLLDHFESRDKWFFTFELATGGELFKRIRRSRFTEENAADCVKQILTGLAYIHSKNIVHRDIKPENILYRTPHPDSVLVVADFGISRVLEGPDDLIVDESGSLQYSSPEVARGEPHGLKTDIWSVGVITYKILSGCEAFRAVTDRELLYKITHTPMSFPTLMFNHVSDTSKEFCLALSRKKAEDRPSAKEALEHPWLNQISPTEHDLSPAFNARAQWNKTLTVIRATNRMRAGSDDTDVSWGTPSPSKSSEHSPDRSHKTPSFGSPMEERNVSLDDGDIDEYGEEGDDDDNDTRSFHTASDGDSDGPFTPLRTGDRAGLHSPLARPVETPMDNAAASTAVATKVDGPDDESPARDVKKKSLTEGMLGKSGIKGMMGKLRL